MQNLILGNQWSHSKSGDKSSRIKDGLYKNFFVL